MPNPTSLERAKLIAARRLAARKKTSEYEYETTIDGEKYWIERNSANGDYDVCCYDWDSGAKIVITSVDSIAEGKTEIEQSAKTSSVKTALNWESDGGEDNWSATGNGFSAEIYGDADGASWEVYETANAGDSPVDSGDSSSVEEAKAAAEAFVSENKTSNMKEGKKLSDTRTASRKEVLDRAKTRQAAVVAATARRQAARKVADTVDPAVPGDKPDEHVETVDVEEQVSVSQNTDHTPEQVSEETGKGGDDSTIAMDPQKSKNENGSNATIGFDPAGNNNKKGAVKKASFSMIAELTDLHLQLGLVESKDKYSKVAEFENLDNVTAQYTINLLRQVKAALNKKTASAPKALPRVPRPAVSPSFGRSASTRISATAADDSTDGLTFLKVN